MANKPAIRYERFIRPMGLRYKKANVTVSPNLKLQLYSAKSHHSTLSWASLSSYLSSASRRTHKTQCTHNWVSWRRAQSLRYGPFIPWHTLPSISHQPRQPLLPPLHLLFDTLANTTIGQRQWIRIGYRRWKSSLGTMGMLLSAFKDSTH